ncbi:hypothetical protein NESM_000099700 [Novymonas esmeraldas]|uniref:Uncharacterized protein n=1 Tax=Novymonas esmeraldas TaxID=1808958 RepID=A0AAW0F3T0_9TRYP
MELVSNFSLLHAKLSRLGFSDWAAVSEGDVLTGHPHPYGLFLRFLYQRFPTATAALIRRYAWFVLEHSDANIGAATVRLLAAATDEAPRISTVQFQQCRYAAAKVALCHSLLRLLRSLTPPPPADRPHAARITLADRAPAAAPAPAATSVLPIAPPANAAVIRLIDQRRHELNALRRV